VDAGPGVGAGVDAGPGVGAGGGVDAGPDAGAGVDAGPDAGPGVGAAAEVGAGAEAPADAGGARLASRCGSLESATMSAVASASDLQELDSTTRSPAAPSRTVVKCSRQTPSDTRSMCARTSTRAVAGSSPPRSCCTAVRT
jgi:hypothetical protein